MLTQLDFSILDFLQAHFRCGFLDAVMPLISALGDAGMIWIVLAVVLLAIPKTRRFGLAVALALIVDLILCNGILKPLVNRPRPSQIRDWIVPIVPVPSDASFPSGHTAAAFSAILALYRSRSPKWLRIPALCLGILTALSRVYLYVHFPSDVLAGGVFGAAFGIVGALIAKHICTRFPKLFKEA